MMSELKIYHVSDRYISYLETAYKNIYSNKIDRRTHTRKYVGVVLRIEDFLYYVPLSSPKDSDFQIAGNQRVVKKSIVPIIRIVNKKGDGQKELKGTLRISHMIPVPESELTLYDLKNESDKPYQDLIQNEISFIRKHENQIRKNAAVLYKQKAENAEIGYVKAALPFKSLEKLCAAFHPQ